MGVIAPDRLVETFLRRWNAHDVDGIVALYAPTARMADPTLERPLVGTEALRRYYASMWRDSPDARLECTALQRHERGVVWLWRFSGSSENGGWSVVGATHFAVAAGLIVADDAIWDPATLSST